MRKELDLSADYIDVRDIIERFEELESELEAYADNTAEHEKLKAILDDLKGKGGDEQWCGDWYPVTLIADSYFTEYARELVTDCGYISRDFPSWIEIDWEATAENVRQDYSSVEIDGETYWYR